MIFGGHLQHVGEGQAFRPMLMILAATVAGADLPVLDDLLTQPAKATDYDGRKRS